MLRPPRLPRNHHHHVRPGSGDGSGGPPGEGQQLASACRVVAAPAAVGGARAGFQVERAGVLRCSDSPLPVPVPVPVPMPMPTSPRCCWLFAGSLQAHAARAHQISCFLANQAGGGAGDLRVGGG